MPCGLMTTPCTSNIGVLARSIIGRAAVAPAHAEPLPPRTTRLADITNSAPKAQTAPVAPQASPAVVCVEQDFSALASACFFHASATVNVSCNRIQLLRSHSSFGMHPRGLDRREHARSAAGSKRRHAALCALVLSRSRASAPLTASRRISWQRSKPHESRTWSFSSSSRSGKHGGGHPTRCASGARTRACDLLRCKRSCTTLR